MRIAIPTDDQVTIAAHAGRAAGFAVYEIEGRTARLVEFRKNSHQYVHGESGKEHYGHADMISQLADCDTVLATGMGPSFMRELQVEGIGVLLTYETNMAKAVDAYVRGKLMMMQPRSFCRH